MTQPVEFVLSEGIEERDKDGQVIRVKGIRGEKASGGGRRDGPEDSRGEMGRDEGDVRVGGLGVGGEAGGKGGVKDSEVGASVRESPRALDHSASIRRASNARKSGATSPMTKMPIRQTGFNTNLQRSPS